MADNLFVYGTLHPDRAPDEIADVVSRLRSIGKGSVQGKIYDLGDYPAVVLGHDGKDRVQGEVFLIPNSPDALTRLDEYEEYLPNDPANSLFKRLRTTVTLDDGSHQRCWVYVYNKSLAGTERIAASTR